MKFLSTRFNFHFSMRTAIIFVCLYMYRYLCLEITPPFLNECFPKFAHKPNHSGVMHEEKIQGSPWDKQGIQEKRW